jgi:hypothetical protein
MIAKKTVAPSKKSKATALTKETSRPRKENAQSDLIQKTEARQRITLLRGK